MKKGKKKSNLKEKVIEILKKADYEDGCQEEWLEGWADQILKETKKERRENLELFLRDMEVRLHSEPFEIVKSAVKEIIKKM